MIDKFKNFCYNSYRKKEKEDKLMTVQEMVEKVAEVYGADSCQLVLMRFIAVRYEKGLGRTYEDCEAHFNSLMEKAK